MVQSLYIIRLDQTGVPEADLQLEGRPPIDSAQAKTVELARPIRSHFVPMVLWNTLLHWKTMLLSSAHAIQRRSKILKFKPTLRSKLKSGADVAERLLGIASLPVGSCIFMVRSTALNRH